ncbi:DUF3488 domain-containing protein [Marinobacter salinexigens]|uniref:DUF3488 domain-containing protein n=1 Tax=Marinobacter salinexigens TaxID=2919747 RepID=A0A5B0VKX6_9GAMM|nr:DUF3488 and DUF4129 domain-containing transglutaminase family protein [Marinobacter salinexigens]KAA1175104.1 DUF3488 domain-containing protein [Marinobacter salinexigens]
MSLLSRIMGDSPSDTASVAAIPSRALAWLVASFALLLIPQWDRLPIWLLAACGVLAGWRWLAQYGRVRLPGRLLRTAIMLLLISVYVATVSGRFTVDTAASFFVLAVGLKWLETRSSRDFYVLLFIVIYLATVNFLFRQEILWTLVNLAGVACLLVGLQVLNAPDLPANMRSGWKRLGLLLLKTLPIVILLFLFFPRIAPLWSVPLVSGQARTGISDSMRPGDISNLAQSSERAFRVTFGGELPAYRDRYWRGLVLDYLDSETWKQSGFESYRPPGKVDLDGGIGDLGAREYDVLMEPTDQRWAFGLENSRAVSGNVIEQDDDLFRFRRPADTAVRYRLAREEVSQGSPADELSALETRRYLQLPVSGNPRARQLGRSLKEQNDAEGVIRAMLSRFRDQEYFYTLRPPAMAENGIDTLLFDEKKGFCAHYAGATTFVLRAAGIPSRIVAGYQGGEPGAGGEYLIVRQYDAHAWVEAWIEGRGWVRIDPTAAIAPQRIESGLREAVANEGSFLEEDWASPQRYGDVRLIQWASLQLDRMNYQWQRWVVGYQGQSQMDLMSRLPGRFGMKELGYLTAAVVGGGLLLAGLVSAWQMRRGVRYDAFRKTVEGWHMLCVGNGVPVRSGETPSVLAERFAEARPAAADSARRFARMVNSHYYSASPSKTAAADLKRLRRLLATMKKQLRRSQQKNRKTGTRS